MCTDSEVLTPDRGKEKAMSKKKVPPSSELAGLSPDEERLYDEFASAAMTGYCCNARIMNKAIDDWEAMGGLRPECVAEFLSGLAYEVSEKMILERRAKLACMRRNATTKRRTTQ